MAEWILVACLVRLRDEFNLIAPNRDHSSDGSIGDDAHEAETSDHNPDETGSVPIHDADHINEVHAIDVDDDLRRSGLAMEMVVQFLLSRCRSGAEKRLRYIIYKRRIWEASNGWRQRTYTGASPHTEHAHFSASYETAKETDTSSWQVKEEFMVSQFTSEDRDFLWAKPGDNPYTDDVEQTTMAGYLRYAPSLNGIENRLLPHFKELSDQNVQLQAQLAALTTQVTQLTELLQSHISGIIEGESQ